MLIGLTHGLLKPLFSQRSHWVLASSVGELLGAAATCAGQSLVCCHAQSMLSGTKVLVPSVPAVVCAVQWWLVSVLEDCPNLPPKCEVKTFMMGIWGLC